MPISKSLPIVNLTSVTLNTFWSTYLRWEWTGNSILGRTESFAETLRLRLRLRLLLRSFQVGLCFFRWDFVSLCELYDVWFLRYKTQGTEFFVIRTIFCLFTPITTQKINILKKWKDAWIYQFTQMYQKSWSYTILFLRSARDKCNFYFSFLATFCPFNPLTAQKIKIFKKLKKKKKNMPGDIIILHMCIKNYDQDVWFLMYGSWDMVHNRQKDGWKK